MVTQARTWEIHVVVDPCFGEKIIYFVPSTLGKLLFSPFMWLGLAARLPGLPSLGAFSREQQFLDCQRGTRSRLFFCARCGSPRTDQMHDDLIPPKNAYVTNHLHSSHVLLG